MGANSSRNRRKSGILSLVPRGGKTGENKDAYENDTKKISNTNAYTLNKNAAPPSTGSTVPSPRSARNDKGLPVSNYYSNVHKYLIPQSADSSYKANTLKTGQHDGTVQSTISTAKGNCNKENPLSQLNSKNNEKISTNQLNISSNIKRSNFILEKTDNLLDHYEIETKQLGQGTYGTVSRGKNKSTGQIRAIKKISKSQLHNIDRFRQEISIMKSLEHPNIVKLYETFEDKRNIYLVMELCSGGELFDRIIEEGHFTERDAAILMKQILSAINYLHSSHVMHRDLKPENFLFLSKERNSPLKIIDFGLSCRFKNSGDLAATKAGTPYYVAPQVLQGSYCEKCDEWSAGVILYILLCGYPPFYGETDSEVLSKVRSGKYSFSGSEWRRISSESKDLIRQLLKMNPSERMPAVSALRHSFIVNMAKRTGAVALPITLMSNLRGFRAQNRLKKVALTVIAKHLSDNEIDSLTKIFSALDDDNSGTLSVKEIVEGLTKLGWSDLPQDLKSIMAEVDSDGSGVIDYIEFIAATIDRRLYIKQDICRAAFEIFDKDGNGRISQDELKEILGMPKVEDAVGRETISALLNEVDLDGDGQIDFDEFMVMMQKRHPDKRAPTRRAIDVNYRS